MTKIFALSALILCSGVTMAQSVDVKGLDTSNDGSTTIEIKKNKPNEIPAAQVKWTTEDGSAEIEGEPSATAKDARAAWKKSCEDWKKEFRADNKDNKVLAINCGTASCSGDAGSKTCSSTATYKIRTRVD